MGLSTAERNRRKRERKKQEREEQRKNEEIVKSDPNENDIEMEVEIEYVPEPLMIAEDNIEFEAIRIVQERSVAVITDDEHQPAEENDLNKQSDDEDIDDYDDDDETNGGISNRKMRELLRPTIAQLKQKVKRPDLVEAHDITAADPEFLVFLKSVPGTVPVPRHWGRKRKYLQGKRGFEKPPFQLPDFIVRTGITEIRDTVAKEEESMSIRQKNRQRVAPKMGAIDVDYRTLHDAFFKHQTKPTNLTKFGDLYYEGKELESKPTNMKPGLPLSRGLRDALGMASSSVPPPWLINMQRYGPPPSWPGLAIQGLNAPLPNADCQYGFHPGGWGKPPIDAYGRPLYGGNPFDPPGSKYRSHVLDPANLVTSDGKAAKKVDWGALPTVYAVDIEEDEPESSDEEMEASSDEEDHEIPSEETQIEALEAALGIPTVSESTMPTESSSTSDDINQTGNVKQLYQVIEQRQTVADEGALFASQVKYVVNSSEAGDAKLAAKGGEDVAGTLKKTAKKRDEDDEDDDLLTSFKF